MRLALQRWKAQILANEQKHHRIFLSKRRLFNERVSLAGGGKKRTASEKRHENGSKVLKTANKIVMKKKILIVQPHSDDALISLFTLINDKKNTVHILTIEKDEKRFQEDLKIPLHFSNVTILPAFGEPAHFSARGPYYKLRNAKKMTGRDFSRYYSRLMKTPRYSYWKRKLRKKIRGYINKGFDVFLPCGIGHPEHWLVTNAIEGIQTYFYRDLPHAVKRKNKNELEKFIHGKRVAMNNRSPKIKLRKLKKIYKSQRILFWYDEKNVMMNEIIYARH